MIARGKTRLTEIASAMKIEASKVSVYLNRLEKNFEFIERRLPFFAKPESNLGRYYLKDITLTFWFRYVYPNFSYIEAGAKEVVIKQIISDFSTYQGFIIEPMVQQMLIQEWDQGRLPLKGMPQFGRYWGKEAEIDIVVHDEKNKQLFLGEVKLNKKRVNKSLLVDFKQKAAKVKEFKHYKEIRFGVITLEKLSHEQQKLLKKQGFWFMSLEDWANNTR